MLDNEVVRKIAAFRERMKVTDPNVALNMDNAIPARQKFLLKYPGLKYVCSTSKII